MGASRSRGLELGNLAERAAEFRGEGAHGTLSVAIITAGSVVVAMRGWIPALS